MRLTHFIQNENKKITKNNTNKLLLSTHLYFVYISSDYGNNIRNYNKKKKKKKK